MHYANAIAIAWIAKRSKAAGSNPAGLVPPLVRIQVHALRACSVTVAPHPYKMETEVQLLPGPYVQGGVTAAHGTVTPLVWVRIPPLASYTPASANTHALVAQMDKASAFEADGCRFESCQGRRADSRTETRLSAKQNLGGSTPPRRMTHTQTHTCCHGRVWLRRGAATPVLPRECVGSNPTGSVAPVV